MKKGLLDEEDDSFPIETEVMRAEGDGFGQN